MISKTVAVDVDFLPGHAFHRKGASQPRHGDFVEGASLSLRVIRLADIGREVAPLLSCIACAQRSYGMLTTNSLVARILITVSVTGRQCRRLAANMQRRRVLAGTR